MQPDQSQLQTPSPAPVVTIPESIQRRSREAITSIARSTPRSSRYEAMRESCASFRLGCSLHPEKNDDR
jgi:hypothetical protein